MNEPVQDILRFPSTRIVDVAKALSGDVRVRILEALGEKPMSVSQLAEALGVAQPTISINVQILEAADLVSSTLGANREKICSATCRSIQLDLPVKLGEGLRRTEELHMPIGMYSHCSVQPTCGIMTRDCSNVGSVDDPRSFYMPERVDAALLWFSGAGYVEYYFSNPMPPGVTIDELAFSAELCAEAPSFQMDWPSDISLYINDTFVGTYTSPGDLGDRKGKLTPDKWRSGTEYGMLTEWRITKEASLVNGAPAANANIDSLGLQYNKPIRVRLEVGEDAANCRGMNLFGSSFGDHRQDLVLAFIRST
ncbi:helix-turn-helix domain-containing protein [Paenibacillus rhizovicinus]|uniref:Helix-turn-helix domain-containing protein n=1 Tax=Paenibacillus rhizovicinus TaxID=2704463 RepID=A0A6C0P309_9BACL|nr:helix-turn-helix domain-containing protein [Paenibacillus rhizovicinus]QHW32857.1 helix-turn-helix domain-containing protein [Paenibacillus rhizovicinus]